MLWGDAEVIPDSFETVDAVKGWWP